MIDKWNSLTQNNKIKLVICILTALFAVFGYFGESWLESSSNDSGPTSGNYSPAINYTNGDVSIDINRSDPEKQP